jgi:pilus assembly protein CpaB
VILIAAVVVGAISAYLVYNYVNSADDRARGNARQVQVLKIAKDIGKGEDGRTAQNQGKIVTAEIPAEFKPVTAIVDPSIIQDKVAVANFATGQIIVDGMFADPIENQITFAGRVPNDCAPGAAQGTFEQCVAVTISVDQIHGVAGVIVPGDLVNIFVTPDTPFCGGEIKDSKGGVFTLPQPGQTTATPGGAALCTPSRILYQAVKVLFVDKTAVPQPGEVTSNGSNAATPTGGAQSAVNSGLITFAVPAKAAQLITSIAPDRIYLTLLPPDYKPEDIGQVAPFPAFLPGEDSNQWTPYGPTGIQNQK